MFEDIFYTFELLTGVLTLKIDFFLAEQNLFEKYEKLFIALKDYLQ